MLYNFNAMDNFSKAEINNRPKALAVIRSILKPEYEVVESPVEEKDHYDFLIRRKSDGKVVALVEHKDRCYTSTTFSDWLLSSKKKIFLDHYSLPTYYLNTFTDGVWAMWDTKNTSYTQRTTYHYTTTADVGVPMEEEGYFYKISDGSSGTYTVEDNNDDEK